MSMQRFTGGISMGRLTAMLLLGAAGISALASSPARAQVLLDETNIVGLPSVAPPAEYSFTATAQALTLTLTDLQVPAAFTSLQVAVTLGDTLVGTATLDPSTHKATLAIPAAAGTYTVDVIGTPDSTQGLGTFGVCVAPSTSPTSCVASYSYSGNIQTPSATSSNGTSTLNTNFTSTVAGNYTVTLTDDTFPAALSTVSAGILQGATPIQVNIPTGPTTVTLAAGTNYELLVEAQAAAPAEAGLYSIQIADPSGAVIFARTLPVGTLQAATIVDNPTAQALSLALTDYQYPAPLANAEVAVTSGATSLATLSAPGTVASFNAPAGSLYIWQYDATAGTQPGTYGLNLSVNKSGGTGASLYSTNQVVNPPSVTATSYAFVATLPSAGTYNLIVNDFQFPAALQQTPTATVAQNGTVLTQTPAGAFTAAAGTVVVVVNATAQSGTSGLFGVTVETSGSSPQILLDQTQAVGAGAVFTQQTINLGTSGGYTVTLADLGFPQTFNDLAVVVSRGNQLVGKIFAAGTFQFTGIPGSQYLVTFVATPGADNYGLYSLNIAPAAPTVTFSASPTSVAAGGAVTLTWSSTNAASCTASGGTGWTGSQATSGTLAVAVSASETLVLTCTGPGGSASQSVSLAATAAPAKSGGGGSLDWAALILLGGLVLGRRVLRTGTG
jgi:hypothetical protein